LDYIPPKTIPFPKTIETLPIAEKKKIIRDILKKQGRYDAGTHTNSFSISGWKSNVDNTPFERALASATDTYLRSIKST